MIADIAPGLISIKHGLRGPNFTTVSACASSANALVDSLEQIEEFVIDELNLNKARMTLVDKDRSNFLLQNMKKNNNFSQEMQRTPRLLYK